MERSYSTLRRQYLKGVLRESDLDKDPFVQLGTWLDDALHSGCPEPHAMILSTCGSDGYPSSRVVLMKEFSASGLTFFSNYESRKGRQLEENPNASVLFYWPRLERQVRLEGEVVRATEAVSDDYFYSRPLPSRISAAISPQSTEIPNREWLEEQWLKAQGNRHGQRVEAPSRPQNWGGYLFIPKYFEFWQGRAERLHDRIIYRPDGEEWVIGRLAP
jgi:pyridoxamine 5'-phosphate oxidase